MQISVHTADVKGILRVYSIEVAAREKDDLNEDPIVTRLRKVRAFLSWTDADLGLTGFFLDYYGNLLHRPEEQAMTATSLPNEYY